MENDPPSVEVVTKEGVTYKVRRLTEVSQILPRLEKDRVFAVYAICQLEPGRFPHTRWYVAEGDTGEALVMHGTGSLRSSLYGYGADLFCMGDPASVEVILCLHPGPRYVSRLWAQVEHAPILKHHFRLVNDYPMVLRKSDRVEEGTVEPPVRRLTGADIGEVNRLYRACGGSLGRYRRERIDRGHWYGIYEDGHLVALSSVDATSPTYRVSLYGRALVHPKYRGRRYVDLVNTARRRDTDKIYSLRVSTLDTRNKGMQRVEARRGVRSTDIGHVLESRAYRRDLVGLASLVRRVLARRRAREAGLAAPSEE